ncbi:MAG: hypothetical protein AB1345_03130 [Chloroflexota bacterium]
MKTSSFDLPAMYGDHHVLEVRRLLFELPGIQEVYASSSFHLVEVDFDESKVSEDNIKAKLKEAGYLGELPSPTEGGTEKVSKYGKGAYFRHSAAYEQTGNVVSFAQKVPFSGRALWPCPGLEPIKIKGSKQGE